MSMSELNKKSYFVGFRQNNQHLTLFFFFANTNKEDGQQLGIVCKRDIKLDGLLT